jgi:hypothetical protein
MSAAADNRSRNDKTDRDDWKERIRAGNILARLEKHLGEGKVDEELVPLLPTQIKAAEIILDRILPRLSAVEQTQVNELDTMSREDLLTRIKSLLDTDPTLLPELVGMSVRQQTSAAEPVLLAKKA